MSKVSKFLKVDRNILIEYIYSDSNYITEPYYIINNNRNKSISYSSDNNSITNNFVDNQLFKIDELSMLYGKISDVSDDKYTYISLSPYGTGAPIIHDSVKIHLPVSWTFGEYLGFYMRVYTFDTTNKKEVDISNFYFDMTDINHMKNMEFSAPPLLFQEKMWGKYIKVDIPSVNTISKQLEKNLPKEFSINSVLGGLSATAPVFIDFHFLQDRVPDATGSQVYYLTNRTTISVSQTPDYERLGLKIEHSRNGDFFEIYGIYNGNIREFKEFIDNSKQIGKDFIVQYDITLYEQNIRGKTITIIITDDFNEVVDFRPIIKYSTTTAIIDVEMKLIDRYDDSVITRRASYGMLQQELSKYSLNLMKLNIDDVSKPKIYNIKTSVNSSFIGGLNNLNGNLLIDDYGVNRVNRLEEGNSFTKTEIVRVPYPVLIDKYNIIARTTNGVLDEDTFYGYGKIMIELYPFDNIVKFTIATGTNEVPKLFDLTSVSDIRFVIKSDNDTVSFPLYSNSSEINLKEGQIVFKVDMNRFLDIKKIYNSGFNVFYITGVNQNVTSVIYTGLFKIFDSEGNLNDLNLSIQRDIRDAKSVNTGIITDSPSDRLGTAVVTRREV